jgi:hypothetical protein
VFEMLVPFFPSRSIPGKSFSFRFFVSHHHSNSHFDPFTVALKLNKRLPRQRDAGEASIMLLSSAAVRCVSRHHSSQQQRIWLAAATAPTKGATKNNVVQSFQVAFSTVLGFGRTENDANTAIVLPKSTIPCSLSCSGDKAPDRKAMGFSGTTAAASRGNVLNLDNAYRLACVRGLKTLSGSSPPDDDPKPLDSVWVQLYVDGEKAGKPALVKLEPGAVVFNLATAVKQVYSNKLDGIDVVDLDVYKDEAKPLRGDEKMDSTVDCGESIDNPIRVTARTPNQGTTIGEYLTPIVFMSYTFLLLDPSCAA